MKTVGFKKVSLLLGAATLMLGLNELGVQAETVSANTVSSDLNEALASPNPWQNALVTTQTNNSPVVLPQSNLATNPVQVENPFIDESAAQPIPGTTRTSASLLTGETPKTVAPTVAQTNGTTPGNTRPDIITPGRSPQGTPAPGTFTPNQTTPNTITPSNIPPGTNTPETNTPQIITPVQTTPNQTTPGTFTPSQTTPNQTTPGTFTPNQTTPGTYTPEQTTPTQTTPRTLTPITPTVAPGRATNSGSSYFGIGANIGIGDGDTQIGQGSFAVISKIGLTRNFSVRPSALFGDDVTVLVPVTYDFSFGEGPTAGLGFTAAPFLGIGAAITTGDDVSADLLLTGGIDVPLTPQFTATASVNASVTGNPAIGLLVGVGYNFSGF